MLIHCLVWFRCNRLSALIKLTNNIRHLFMNHMVCIFLQLLTILFQMIHNLRDTRIYYFMRNHNILLSFKLIHQFRQLLMYNLTMSFLILLVRSFKRSKNIWQFLLNWLILCLNLAILLDRLSFYFIAFRISYYLLHLFIFHFQRRYKLIFSFENCSQFFHLLRIALKTIIQMSYFKLSNVSLLHHFLKISMCLVL